MVKTIVTVLIAVLVPSIVGVVIYKMYLVPAISANVKPAEGGEEGKGEAKKAEGEGKTAAKSESAKGHAESTEEETPISPESAPFELPEEQATVKTGPDEPQAVLVYSCALVCANEELLKLVEKNKQWFIAVLGELHRNRTVAELNNPEVQKTILEQGKEQCNVILRRMEMENKKKKKAEGAEADGIIAVLHTKWAIFTL